MKGNAARRGRPVLNVLGWTLILSGVLLAGFFGIFTLFSVSALFAGPAGTEFAVAVFWIPLIAGGALIAIGLVLAFTGGAMVKAAKPVDLRDLA